jgi:hypothetical protein
VSQKHLPRKANLWIHVLHKVLNQALEEADVLPATNANSLEVKLDKLAKETINTTAEETELEAGSSQEANEIENMEIIQLFLHEAIERPIIRPIYNEVQHIFYSGKKKHHTVKNILITDVNGYVYFLSSTCEGKKHNKKIADEARYSLPEGSYLGQDSGFQGFDIPNVTNVQPKKKPQGGELTKDEKVRVRVEHAIGGVKRYRIVKDKLRSWKCGFKDLVIKTCCGLHNFRLNFRPWNYEMAII